MFNQPELIIDTIQNAKKQWTEKCVRNIDIKNHLNIYVDAQTKFLKTALASASGISSTIGQDILNTKVEKLFNPFGIDFFKAGWDAWSDANRADNSKKS